MSLKDTVNEIRTLALRVRDAETLTARDYREKYGEESLAELSRNTLRLAELVIGLPLLTTGDQDCGYCKHDMREGWHCRNCGAS
jgi:hypothetical protein